MVGLALSYDGGAKTSYTTDAEAWNIMLPEPEQTVIFHNAKFDLGVLRRTGLPLPPKWEDTLIAAHLLNETGEHGLKPLAKQHLGVADPLTFADADRMRLLNPEVFSEYAKNDARYTFRLWQQFGPELERQELQVAYKLEKSVLPVVMAMEARGMLIDVAALRKAGAETDAELKRLAAEIHDHAGCKFDLRSPQKLGVILTAKLGLSLPTGGKKGAPITDKHALKDLAGQHPIIPPLLEYRELDKLASAFIAKLPGLADADGRIHPVFNQLGATSGRFTCSNPNVQQMPRSSGLAALLRASFIAGPGRKLVCADWSQIELRVLAHFSQDRALIEAFLSGADLHARTAALMFGKDENAISKRERTIAKSINFGIAYGMGAPGLFRSLNAARIAVNQDECAEFINTYHASYPGVRRFLDAVGRTAQRQGFIRTLAGRKRRLNDDSSNMLSVKNAVIQGSAADIAKHAMVRLHKALPEGAHLIAMVHDEFIVDCPAQQAADVLALVKATMERPPKGFLVPLVVDAQIGDNWGACK
jgi:DNA polymerase-1